MKEPNFSVVRNKEMTQKKSFIAIDKEILNALKSCASKDPLRENLQGVYFNPKGYIEATDGHKLIRVPFDIFWTNEDVQIKYEVNDEVVRAMPVEELKGLNVLIGKLKLKKTEVLSFTGKSEGYVDAVILRTTGDKNLLCHVASLRLKLITKDPFPDTNEVVPDEEPPQVCIGAGLLQELLSAWHDHRQHGGDLGIHFQITGPTSPVNLKLSHGIKYTIMPMRTSQKETE